MILRGLALAGVWLSPPVLLVVGPFVLADGGRGPWVPAVLAGAACLVAVALGPPWGRLRGAGAAMVTDLARTRWPLTGRSLLPLTLGSAGSALLFLGAQLAASRELVQAAGWPAWTAIAGASAVLALAAWRDDLARGLVTAGGGLAVVGVLLPLGAVAATTDPVWPRVWDAVASRGKVTFSSEGAWAREGRPVRGGGSEVTLTAVEELRLTLLARGHVRLEPWEGAGRERDVSPATDLTLRPGDRLVLGEGFPVRFQPGRAIPGAPASGPEWLSPPRRPEAWRDVAGVGITLLLGGLGLAPVHAALPCGHRANDRAARLGAALAVVGLVAALQWSLYAAWLTPEIYAGGVAGSEVYELPAHVAGLGAARIPLADLARLGLVGGGIAGALLALRALPLDPVRGVARRATPVVVALAALGFSSLVAQAAAWSLLIVAFGLAASTTAPAAVLACWRERLDAHGVGVGAALGLAVFVGLTVLSASGLAPRPEASWLAWLAAWPAVAGASANVLAAWLLSRAPAPSPRSPLPPGLADLHA